MLVLTLISKTIKLNKTIETYNNIETFLAKNKKKRIEETTVLAEKNIKANHPNQ